MREGVYLEKMAEFAALLRHEGLTVGLRETEDMCRILSELDLADRGTVYVLTIVGQIEGHQLLPPTSKSTKYEHVLPLLATIEGSRGRHSGPGTRPRQENSPNAAWRQSGTCKPAAIPSPCGRTSKKSTSAWARTSGNSSGRCWRRPGAT